MLKSTLHGQKAYSWAHIVSSPRTRQGAYDDIELKMDDELMWVVRYAEYEIMPRWMAGSF